MSSGGGGSSSTSTVPKEFMPYLEKGLELGTSRLESMFDEQGNLRPDAAGKSLAGFTEQQLAGQEAQTGLAQQAIEGTGIYDTQAATQRMLQNVAGANVAGSLGSLGSARGDRAREAALSDMAMDFALQRQQQAEGGAQSLQDVGLTQQQQQQALLDVPKEELGFYSQFVTGNLPRETRTSGGGK